MEIINPKPKKIGKFSSIPLPSIKKNYKTLGRIKGVYNGFSVYVKEIDDIKKLCEMGYFGKGNLSRSYPQFNKKTTEIIRERQYSKRVEWAQKNSTANTHFKKMITVNDSDDEYENYFNNLQPTYQLDKSSINEMFCLSLEEAFFLFNCLETLDIYLELNKMNSEEIWKVFSETDPYFVPNYVAYNYFRSKNWIVKSGIKFGGDFLLYKEGPQFYHASYVVITDVFNENHKRIDELTKRSMDNISLLCLDRLCTTAGKELMVCEITLPKEINFNNFQNVIIKEVLLNRCTNF